MKSKLTLPLLLAASLLTAALLTSCDLPIRASLLFSDPATGTETSAGYDSATGTNVNVRVIGTK